MIKESMFRQREVYAIEFGYTPKIEGYTHKVGYKGVIRNWSLRRCENGNI